MYYNGESTATDKNKAFYWIQKSAVNDYNEAQFLLGVIYFTGDGTSIDKKKAAYWIKESYENGYEKAKEFWDKNQLYKYLYILIFRV